MKPSQKIIDFIKNYEKLALKAYMPTPNDRPTIGYGMTVYPNGTKVNMGDVITKEKAESDFALLLTEFSNSINPYIKATLTQNQYDAVLSLAYNIGVGAFKDSTLLRKMNLNPADKVIPDWFLAWNKQAGAVLKGLTKRRTQEREIYIKGIYDSTH